MTAFSDTELERRRRAGTVPFWRALVAGARDAELVEYPGGVVAAVLPRSPARSVMNGVFYEDGAALLAVRDELAERYAAAGVAAWTVWLLPGDSETAAGLERAGHVLDATPAAMGGVLSEMDLAARDDGIEVIPSDDWTAMARLNALAYDTPEEDWVAALGGQGPALGDLYVIGDPGRPAACAFISTHERNAEVCFVATRAELRGRGLAGELLRHALREAAATGCQTTTLEATKLGRPVYERMGFRVLGELQMWERRTSP
ncbi:MAG: GNAT family N-acetyltransferase [Solirubrobacteraceae bacterium]|nr:GNAT family N-acetyltransferase [Solirubrobacteraceae bacterium]